MLVEVRQQSLHIGLQHIAAGLALRAVSPILLGIKIQAGAHGLSLTACNASMALQYIIPCQCDQLKIDKEGSTVIPARLLLDIVRSFSNESKVKLAELKHNFIHIESDHSIYSLATMDVSQFPDMRSLENKAKFQIDNIAFKKIVKQVSFAASTSEAKPILTGISCQTINGKLRLSATDGVRLATSTSNLSENSSDSVPFVIPAKHLSDYSKMLSDGSSKTQITISDHVISFNTLNFSMQSLLIQGTFPVVERLVPQTFSTEITMNTAPFLRAVQRVSLLVSDTHAIGMRISSCEVELFAAAAEIGDVSEKFAINPIFGEPLVVFFNGKYMRDILQAIDSTQVLLRFTGKNKPILVRPTNNEDTLYIISPVLTAHQL
ncbi:DNA polymerase III subunit beta [Paenibacillus sp. NRS-1760]|uniref:DNA polymerase III subunit beta n=1 Tax=Paenibacillus sp. NRS-1760 TaxID=3233902 RepID=UPI003D2ACABD